MTKKTASTIVNRLNSQTYLLAYGEYERPDYSVRKKRGSDHYDVMVRYHFYAGTLHAKKNGVLHSELVHKATQP